MRSGGHDATNLQEKGYRSFPEFYSWLWLGKPETWGPGVLDNISTLLGCVICTVWLLRHVPFKDLAVTIWVHTLPIRLNSQ